MPTGLWLYSYLALWALLLAVSIVLVAMLRNLGALHRYWVRNDPEWGPPLGALAPALPREDAYGRPVSFAAGRGKKTILLFLSRGCPSCRRALSEIPDLQERPDAELVLVVSGKETETRLFLAEGRRERFFPDVPALADSKRELWEAYRIAAVPYAVVVDEDEHVGASGAVWSRAEIGLLVSEADARREARQAGGAERGPQTAVPSGSPGAAAARPSA